MHGYTYIYIYSLEESPPFGIALGPHVEHLGQHFSSILIAFGHPWKYFGRHWAPLGQPCRLKGENKEFVLRISPAWVPIWVPFGEPFFNKIV